MFKDEKKDTISFIRLVYRNRKLLSIAILLSLLFSTTTTFLMPNKYYSAGIIFSANTNTRGDNPQFGYEMDANQLIQLLESEKLRDIITKEFNLIVYYKIDTANAGWQEQLAGKYTADISFTRSKYMSIVISATTENPELSAKIVNSIIDRVNGYRVDIVKENQSKDLVFKKEAYLKQKNKMDSLISRIYEIKKPDTPDKLVYNHLLMELQQQAPSETFNYVSSTELEKLMIEYKFQFARVQALKEDYERAEYYSNRPFPKNYVVDLARPHYKKASPSLVLNCLVGTSGTLILTILMLFAYDRWKQTLSDIKPNEN